MGKSWIKTGIVALLLGLVVADAATAQRRRREERRDARTEESQKEQTAASTVNDAELVAALGLFVYPAGGQNDEQQRADQTECAGWARQQLEEMPAPDEPVAKDEASRREQRREGGRGALKGAAAGAVIGEALEDDEPERPKKKDLEDFEPPDSRDEIGDNVGKAHKDDGPSDAAVGAAVGAVVGNRRGKKAQAQAETEAARAQAEAAEEGELDDLRKAVRVCLEGKGYEVE